MDEYNTKTILICNQKGGVGKTWLADELCFMCEKSGIPYSFRNYDPQGGANHQAQEVDNPGLIIIDTPGVLTAGLNDLIRDADLILIPTLLAKPCIAPLERMLEIMQPWQQRGKEVIVVHNQWDRFTSTADFEDWFFEKYANQKTITLSSSEVVKQAIERGVSVVDYRKHSKSALEMMAFYNYIMETLYGKRQ